MGEIDNLEKLLTDLQSLNYRLHKCTDNIVQFEKHLITRKHDYYPTATLLLNKPEEKITLHISWGINNNIIETHTWNGRNTREIIDMLESRIRTELKEIINMLGG